MMSAFHIATASAILIGLATSSLAQPSCRMPQDFNDPHLVAHDANKSLFWVRPLQVDADGTPRAYHRDDPHGTKGKAIEYIGNGMTIERDGKALPFNPNEKDNAEWLAIYRKIVANGWKAPLGYSVDIYGFAKDEKGKVCVRKDGRLISQTSLVTDTSAGFCNPKRYADALKIPGIVVPNRADNEPLLAEADPVVATPFAQRGVGRGDLAVVYNPETGLWKGALLYDTGPRDLLGEGSLRLVMNLRGLHKAPTSGPETNSLGLVETYTVMFPGTAIELGQKKPWMPEAIEQLAAEKFKEWGGGSFNGALQRMFACADYYKSKTR